MGDGCQIIEDSEISDESIVGGQTLVLCRRVDGATLARADTMDLDDLDIPCSQAMPATPSPPRSQEQKQLKRRALTDQFGEFLFACVRVGGRERTNPFVSTTVSRSLLTSIHPLQQLRAPSFAQPRI